MKIAMIGIVTAFACTGVFAISEHQTSDTGQITGGSRIDLLKALEMPGGDDRVFLYEGSQDRESATVASSADKIWSSGEFARLRNIEYTSPIPSSGSAFLNQGIEGIIKQEQVAIGFHNEFVCVRDKEIFKSSEWPLSHKLGVEATALEQGCTVAQADTLLKKHGMKAGCLGNLPGETANEILFKPGEIKEDTMVREILARTLKLLNRHHRYSNRWTIHPNLLTRDNPTKKADLSSWIILWDQ